MQIIKQQALGFIYIQKQARGPSTRLAAVSYTHLDVYKRQHMEIFSSLASAVRPSSIFSDQAISIVKQFVESGAREFWEHKVLGPDGTSYHLIGGSGQLQIAEPRFMEDDLNTLVELGVLRLDFGSRGTRKFIITRQAVQLANST